MARSLVYKAYAKLNLYLEVFERRRDGYHDIETIFQTVGLADELRFDEQSGLTLTCDVAELESENNLALRAANLLRDQTGVDHGVHIDIRKRIPVAAGLAGGSADAAVTLIALNELWKLGEPTERLRDYAAQLGSDVPYLTLGGTVAATGRGDHLTPLDPIRKTWFLLLHPPLQVSAARVYNHPNLRKSHEPRTDSITDSFRVALETLAKGALSDVFHNAMEFAVFSEHPELAVLKQRMLDAGCASALMSGSGPTLFGLCKNQEHAQAIAAKFPDVSASVVPSVPAGVERVS